MTQSFNDTILKEAISWIESGQQVALATVVQTWGSSPFQIGSKMIIDETPNKLFKKRDKLTPIPPVKLFKKLLSGNKFRK